MMKHLVFMLCLIIGVRSQLNKNEKRDIAKCIGTWIKEQGILSAHKAYCTCSKQVVEKHKTPFPFNGRSPKVYVNDYELEENGKKTTDSLVKITQQFNPKWDTKILTHGFLSDSTSKAVQLIKKAYAQRGQMNIFAIDWGEYVRGYIRAVNNTLEVGRAVAKLIDVLVEVRKADPQRIHLIGHSLGAHVMGIAGAHTRYRVGRITGLDPAKPCFEELVDDTKRLDRSDAELVDVIHTCANILGYFNKTGVADFYINGGNHAQPGCGYILGIIYIPFLGVVCSHSRSYEYYAESIYSPIGFQATRCEDLEQAYNGTCNGQKVLMGDPMPTNTEGIFYVKTNNKKPFALRTKKNE